MIRVIAFLILGAFMVGMIWVAAWVTVTQMIPLWQTNPDAFVHGGALAIVFMTVVFGGMRLLIWAAEHSV